MSELWSGTARNRGYYAFFALSALSVLVLFWPYVHVLVFAGVTATVASPIHEQLTVRFRGRRLVAAIVTTALVALLVLWPISLLLYRFALEGVALARLGLDWLGNGNLETRMGDLRTAWEWIGADALAPYLPEDFDPVAAAAAPAERIAETLLGSATQVLPWLLEGFASSVIDGILFVLTVIALLSDGPRLGAFTMDLIPLDSDYQRRLYGVFREFANNSVVGAFVVAVSQGIVATLGYVAFGVPRALFFGVVTGVTSFVPIVGTAVVALPMVIWVGTLHGWGWGLGLAAYAVGIIGMVDNVIRPVVIRGSSRIHPLLIFLAVFGGLQWMGLVGALVGPVLVAFFLALATIHREMGAPDVVEEEVTMPSVDPTGEDQ